VEDGTDIDLLGFQMDSRTHIKSYFIAKLLEKEIFITASLEVTP